MPTVIDLYFKINDTVIAQGYYLYKKYKSILLEAQGIILSENNYNYKEYRKRVLLNYAVGFMKIELKKQENSRKKG